MAGSCAYVHDPAECDSADGGDCPLDSGVLDEDGVWRCPRERTDGELCSFHAGEAEPADLERAVNVGSDVGDQRRRRRLKQFVGVELADGAIERGAVLDAGDDYPIDLRHATLGRFEASDVTVGHDLLLDDATLESLALERAEVRRSVSARHATVTGDVALPGAELGSGLDLEFATVEGRLLLRQTTTDGRFRCAAAELGSLWAPESEFGGRVACHGVEVEGDVVLVGATFHGEVKFLNATFGSVAAFSHARFAGLADFSGTGDMADHVTRFGGPAKFPDVTFEGRTRFEHAVFEGRVNFVPEQVSGRTVFECDASFDDARFEASVDLTDVTFRNRASLVGVEVLDDVRIDAASASRISLSTVSRGTRFELRGVEFRGGRIRLGNGTEFRFRDATLGDVEFVDEAGNRSLTGVSMIDTLFEGFRLARYRIPLERQDYRLHPEDADASPARLESTYLNAKVAASDSGANAAAAEFFLRQMRYRRRKHRARMGSGGAIDRLEAAFEYGANLLFDAAAGYGERPNRTLLCSGATVGLFALAYAALGALEPGGTPLRYLLFSFQSFITFILGPAPAAASRLPVQVVSAAEGFVGAFLVALFVFTLTRSVDR